MQLEEHNLHMEKQGEALKLQKLSEQGMVPKDV